MYRIIAPLLLFCSSLTAQTGGNLFDGRKTPYCESCIRLVNAKQNEIQFGVQITTDGEVYFSISNREWFEQLLQSSTDGIAIDIVSKDKYACDKPVTLNTELKKGYVLPTVYLPELKKRIKDMGAGHIAMLIGNVPPHLKNQQLEGNLAIIKNGVVCFYTYFTDLERSLWQFLPMGLFTDTLVNKTVLMDSSDIAPMFYTKKLHFSVPFPKNKAVFSAADIKPLYDSLSLTNFRIKRIDIRAYSSVEGSEDINISLQEKRAQSMVKALQQYQTSEIVKNISSSENWIEFYNDIKKSSHPELSSLSKPEVKLKLLDKSLNAELEPVLKNHRKAVVTIYLDNKSTLSNLKEGDLAARFKDAIVKKELYKASLIQTEIFERIADNRLPADYMDKLEIPQEKFYMSLLNSQQTYKYELGLVDEYDAIQNLKLLLKLDPENPKVSYNICALSFPIWAYDSSFVKPDLFLNDINSLQRKGINESLVMRMLVNYHIRMCELHMAKYRYDLKDKSLAFIMANYSKLQPSDEDLYSLAKYLAFYARFDWAMQIVAKRTKDIDASENLVFYYVVLSILLDPYHDSPDFRSAVANAVVINRDRFCKIFNSTNNGGSSFQLLESVELKKIYCESCNK